MTKITPDKIRAMSVYEQRLLLKNVLDKLPSPDAQTLLAMIDEVGRPDLSDEQVRLDDPIGRLMERVIFSPEGRAAAIAATERGEAALAGIEPLLQTALKGAYRANNGATVQAGYLVARMMESAGYERTGRKDRLGLGSVAASAEIFVRAKNLPSS